MHNIHYNNNFKLLIQLRLSIRLKDNEKQYRLPRLGKLYFFMKKKLIYDVRCLWQLYFIFIPEASSPRPPMFESVHRTDARFETILGKTK